MLIPFEVSDPIHLASDRSLLDSQPALQIQPDLLRQIRLERKLTQEELADRAGLNRLTVNRIENGVPNAVRRRTLEALARVLTINREALTGQTVSG